MEEEKDARARNILVIFTLPHGLRRHWDKLKDECSIWEELGRGIIAWSINEFINNTQQNRKLIPSIKIFHDQFISHAYPTLSDIDKGFWVESTKWSGQEVQVTLSRDYRAAVPFWDRVVKVDEPEIKRFPHKGVLINKHLATGFSEAVGETMPGHFIPTMIRQLKENHYVNAALQQRFNANEEKQFDHFYVAIENAEFFDGFLYSFKRFLQGEKDLVGAPAYVENTAVKPAQKSSTWSGKPQRVSVDGQIFKTPGKAANEKRIPINQVYSRLYSHLPDWKAWYFIGTKKDPNCH